MQALLFYIFSGLTLLCALLVVANPFSRNPVTSAMFLVLTIASLAGIFILLHAFFLAAVQVLVYAGAVMVLFLFVIMLLDLRAEQRRRVNVVATLGGGIVTIAFVAQLIRVLRGFAPGHQTFPPLAARLDDVRNVGTILFTTYNLP